jgi:ribosome-binding protein aMBF1 (putative translation factor)
MKPLSRGGVLSFAALLMTADVAIGQVTSDLANQAAAVQQHAADLQAQQQAAIQAQQEQASIRQQYGDRIMEAENQVARAQNELANCAIQEQMDVAKAKGDKSAADGQAAQNLASGLGEPLSSLGKAAEGVLSGGGDEKKYADNTMKAVKRETEERANEGFNPPDTSGLVTVSKPKGETYCKNKYPSTTPAEESAKETLRRDCYKDLQAEARDLTTRYQNAQKDFKGASHMTSDAFAGVLGAGVAALGYGMQTGANKGNLKMAEDNAKMVRQQCENAANLAISEAQKLLAKLTADRDEALVLASLTGPTLMPTNPTGGTSDSNDVLVENYNPGGGIAYNGTGLGAPQNLNPATIAAVKPPGGGDASTPIAGAPGGGGGSPGGGDAWTFGGGAGNSTGAGLPMQADAGTYGAEGGGGFFGGPPSNDGGGGLGGLLASEEYEEGAGGSAAFGDGGIQVLLSKMRQRLAAHGHELRKSLDAPPMVRAAAPVQQTRGIATQN